MNRVVIAGSSGLVGTALRDALQADGRTVIRLVRRRPTGPGEVAWDPSTPEPGLLRGADVVVNLAGAGLADRRWNAKYREAIRHSRIHTTAALAAMAAAQPPGVLVSASGIRWYGIDRGETILSEEVPPGSPGFLPSVAQEWEAATAPATAAGVRVCHLRTGLVLTRRGGILPAMLPVFRFGLGARCGSGREYWSHVSLGDTVRAIRFLADHRDAEGPYNITAPEPVTNREFTRALARALSRPAVLRVPMGALRLAMGDIAGEVLGSLRVVPRRLTEAGFRFAHPDIDAVLRAALTD